MSTPEPNAEIIKFITCDKPAGRCETLEICGVCIRRLNPEEFKTSLLEILETWMEGRAANELKEMHSLCPAIDAMIHSQERGILPCESSVSEPKDHPD
ncbi:MAG: hypothetical protein PHE55_14680 [Methylococcaceae bacterium]|nr:hypothetical protein [Methylococcaceae bacterium]